MWPPGALQSKIKALDAADNRFRIQILMAGNYVSTDADHGISTNGSGRKI